MNADWKRVTEVLNEALELDSLRRHAYLDDVAKGEPAVRREVDSLLASLADSSREDFLESSPVSLTLRPGDSTGDFEIVETLGSGSFATVYLARQRSLNRRIALKVSPNFGEEARTMAHLEHDNIVKIYSESLDVTRDARMICMQYVPGTTLEKVLVTLAGGKRIYTGEELLDVIDGLSSPESAFNPAALKDRETLSEFTLTEAILWMGLKLADALSYAHGRGVLHLDVKPGNILLSPYGRPMLTDFNISVSAQATEENRPKLFGGTLDYMAPEHLDVFNNPAAGNPGDRIDARADVFALGVVLREMFQKLGAKSNDEIESLLDRCTDSDPEKRFASAGDLAKALEGCLELLHVCAAMPPLGPVLRITKRHALWAVAGFILIPNVLGSVINISYNHIRIVSNLTPSQIFLFRELCVVYNVIVYPLCVWFMVKQFRPLRGCLNSKRWLCATSADNIDDMRRHVLRLPLKVVALTTMGWMPGSIFFPLAIQLLEGPLEPHVFLHFFISFALSWLIALTYSFLYMQFVTLRLLYPRFWLGKNDIRRTATRELSIYTPSLRAFHFMAGFVPLIGAAIVVLVGPERLDASSYGTYRLLVALLIGLGMVGLISALQASSFLAQTLFALTGSDNNPHS